MAKSAKGKVSWGEFWKPTHTLPRVVSQRSCPRQLLNSSRSVLGQHVLGMLMRDSLPRAVTGGQLCGYPSCPARTRLPDSQRKTGGGCQYKPYGWYKPCRHSRPLLHLGKISCHCRVQFISCVPIGQPRPDPGSRPFSGLQSQACYMCWFFSSRLHSIPSHSLLALLSNSIRSSITLHFFHHHYPSVNCHPPWTLAFISGFISGLITHCPSTVCSSKSSQTDSFKTKFRSCHSIAYVASDVTQV